ncbi:FAD-binding oxidoreductase [Tenggerimyces flavus]|uniref:FAD-binding oxidoreductase n=1 Tax=Tenggerimyces flavus TaxID=1708749 RepID=A0ABV7Y5Z8_9ACTN|nr:FAD-dependent oxidoreductase [Tenggerimyces flavus]MBM7785108.1 FAD/FMN-containing dehydrogenase [Tenggerimyces flavus]
MVPDELELHRRLAGEYIHPDDPKYPEVRNAQLKAFHHYKPKAVVRAFTAEDVAETITFAKQRGIELRPRSGGHCFAGRSSTDGIVLDLSPMWGFAVEGDTATIGAGATIRTIERALWRQGRILNLGCGPTVGVAGLTLGGGIGLCRAYGLTCDRLLKAAVVLADGSIVHADENHHEDLFWALRGAGGGQFGVVAHFQHSFSDEPHQDVIANWMRWARDCLDGMNAHLRLVATPT